MKHQHFKRIFLLIGICISYFVTNAQTLLESISLNRLSDKDKPALLTQLAERNRINGDYKGAIQKAQQSAALALKFKNLTEATKAYTIQSSIYATTKEFVLSKKAGDSAFLIAQQSRQPVAMAYAYYAQALFYNAIDNSEQITKYCGLALKLLEKVADPYLSAKIYYLLYMVNTHWDDVKNVNKYARAATENALKTTDYNLLSNCYIALSVAADYNYASNKNEALRDSIIYYLNKAQSLYQQYPKYVARKTYGIACVNSADYYLRYFSDTDQAAKANAIRYAEMANEVMKGAINGEEIRASSLGILSEYARRDKNFVMTEAYLQEAYSVLKTQKVPYYYTLINVSTALATFYEQQGEYKKALELQKRVTEYNSKYFDEKRTLNAQKLEVQYEAEKKSNEVKLLKQREKYARQQKYLYIGIAIASILGLIFMFRSYHFRLRYSLQRERQLHLEKQDAELQMKFEKEEQARLKAEQLLLESQQQQLQKEMMASQLQLEHKKEMLFQLKEKLIDNQRLNIKKIWNEELLLDNDFEEAKFQIQEVHPEFFSLINQRAQQKLTPLDLKLCAYLHLKMDTKKIARLMNIEAKSVRMSCYRIKQKLGLGRDEDLKLFLQDIG
ncbi:helix-turn-helix transcriptional regulator [Pedobacter sp. KLB.chiD]|uniref:helix-turn-helix transcriptional regulator n=1 Tax=Pedobacter sp. KLB.chiD TaxID=3387402 RepID=UPI003999E8C2